MRYRYLLLFIVMGIFGSCKKEGGVTHAPSPTKALLKDMVLSSLPSPFYHFEYDAAGRPVFASFASDFTRYDIVYEGDRIRELRNNIIVNNDTLRYEYDEDGRVAKVNYINGSGIVYTQVVLSYDGQRLIKLDRSAKSGPDFILNKSTTLSYYPDGNLQEITDNRLSTNGQPGTTIVKRFEQYDDKINVDGFDLIHSDFFDHLILLPGVQLQKNNPGKETLFSDGSQYYSVIYTYTYNANKLPLRRDGQLTYASGANAGQTIHISSEFSYY